MTPKSTNDSLLSVHTILPPELWLTILELLDRPSLLECSIINTTFSAFCARFLWSSITLPFQSRNLYHLLHLLTKRPERARAVKSLILRLGPITPHTAKRASHLLSDVPVLLNKLFALMTGVRALEITAQLYDTPTGGHRFLDVQGRFISVMGDALTTKPSSFSLGNDTSPVKAGEFQDVIWTSILEWVRRSEGLNYVESLNLPYEALIALMEAQSTHRSTSRSIKISTSSVHADDPLSEPFVGLGGLPAEEIFGLSPRATALLNKLDSLLVEIYLDSVHDSFRQLVRQAILNAHGLRLLRLHQKLANDRGPSPILSFLRSPDAAERGPSSTAVRTMEALTSLRALVEHHEGFAQRVPSFDISSVVEAFDALPNLHTYVLSWTHFPGHGYFTEWPLEQHQKDVEVQLEEAFRYLDVNVSSFGAIGRRVIFEFGEWCARGVEEKFGGTKVNESGSKGWRCWVFRRLQDGRWRARRNWDLPSLEWPAHSRAREVFWLQEDQPRSRPSQGAPPHRRGDRKVKKK
ncbi:hypothetical protein DL93DRAFT_2077821 [Clavulina sp. PMI_390]|nr:hypothetical protein DL93DRAFT_2077821 [Clavulina sp. PMI_390]